MDKGSVGVRSMAAMRLFVLFSAFFVCLLLAAAVGVGVQAIPGIEERTALLIVSAFQCVVAFCIPAWICARFSSDTPWKWLHATTVPAVRSFIGVVVVYVLALPAMNQLIEWNASIHFPSWASGIEETLRGWEEANGEVGEKILAASGFWQTLSGILIVGILTGFSEELLFRGALQGVFVRSSISKGAAVWAAAAIFSAIHFQFFGFVPRMLMGAFFGYLLLWSGSIWLPVFAHALNNSLVVLTISMTKGESGGIDTFGVAGEGEIPWAAIFSFVATALLLWKFRSPLFKNVSSHG